MGGVDVGVGVKIGVRVGLEPGPGLIWLQTRVGLRSGLGWS